jgi:hypothetical protein
LKALDGSATYAEIKANVIEPGEDPDGSGRSLRGLERWRVGEAIGDRHREGDVIVWRLTGEEISWNAVTNI